MRLVTFRHAQGTQDRLGVAEAGEVVDLTALAERSPDGVPRDVAGGLLGLLRSWEAGLSWARSALETGAGDPDLRLPLSAVRLRSPLPRPNSLRDFMLVEEHVKNSFPVVPPEWYEIPVYWKGNCDTVFGPEDTVPWPGYTDKLDYELEIAAIIGRRAYQVNAGDAAACIAGYTIFNDWSARDIQFREMKVGLGPGLGKDFATSLGPCMVTADAIDIASAPMAARVNGEIWSQGTLGAMRLTFPEVIEHLSQEQPLQPGDVLGSGTVGRGCGLELDRWLRPGDVIELEVGGIGVLRNRVGSKNARLSLDAE